MCDFWPRPIRFFPFWIHVANVNRTNHTVQLRRVRLNLHFLSVFAKGKDANLKSKWLKGNATQSQKQKMKRQGQNFCGSESMDCFTAAGLFTCTGFVYGAEWEKTAAFPTSIKNPWKHKWVPHSWIKLHYFWRTGRWTSLLLLQRASAFSNRNRIKDQTSRNSLGIKSCIVPQCNLWALLWADNQLHRNQRPSEVR